MTPKLAREQMFGRGPQLLRLGVLLQLHQLQPFEQRHRDRFRVGRRGDERHLGQVERQADVVVAESAVAHRVEHVEQRVGRRVVHPVDPAEYAQRVRSLTFRRLAVLPQPGDDASVRTGNFMRPVTARRRRVAIWLRTTTRGGRSGFGLLGGVSPLGQGGAGIGSYRRTAARSVLRRCSGDIRLGGQS